MRRSRVAETPAQDDVAALPLGARITVVARLKRELTREPGSPNYRLKAWLRRPLGEWRPAIIVGYRTLSDGLVDYMGEDGVAYTPRRHYKAALVAFDVRRAPFFAHLDDIKVAP
jgi:hypothetical protein